MIYDLINYISFGIIISEIFFLVFDLDITLSIKNNIILSFINLFMVVLFHYLPLNNDIFEYILMGISICIAFKENKLKSLGIYTFTCFCIYQLKLYLLLVFFSFTYKTGKDIHYPLLSSIIYIVIVIIFTSYFMLFRKKWKIRIERVKKTRYKYFIIVKMFIMIINVALISSYFVFVKNNSDINENLAQSAISFTLSFILVFVGFFISQIITQNLNYKEILIMNTRFISQQKIYYENMIKHQENIKKIEHDIKHHLLAIHAFVSNNEYNNAMEYIENSLKEINLYSDTLLFENIILDTIFNEYKKMIDKNNINVNIRGKYPQDLKIDNYSLCVIFSNLLLNAIEACTTINNEQERYIDIELKSYRNFLYMTFKNSYQTIRPTLKTTKYDTRNHGLGLQNIRMCVENNNGNIEISYDENNFYVNVMLQGVFNCE